MIRIVVVLVGVHVMAAVQLLTSTTFIEQQAATPVVAAPAASAPPTKPPLSAKAAAAADAERMRLKMNHYIGEAAKGFDRNVQNALKQVDGPPRQLLALRGYLRGKSTLKSRWAWTAAQMKKYRKSSEYSRSMGEVARVKMTFAMLNPGYELKVNTEVRTLEEQISLWNSNRSVEKPANAMFAAAMKELADSTQYAETPDRKSLRDFVSYVRDFKVTGLPTVATPGLSQHGQLRAFDFIIVQGDQIIAGASTGNLAGTWDNPGWTTKLKVAIATASDRFSGPLAAPREPWHYTYNP